MQEHCTKPKHAPSQRNNWMHGLKKRACFYENFLNFENGSINVIARRSILTFMS
jgi:hypothetical protein